LQTVLNQQVRWPALAYFPPRLAKSRRERIPPYVTGDPIPYRDDRRP
jgi:hypothetical protein